MEGTEFISTGATSPDDLYRVAADKYGSSPERLASAYEADPEKRRHLSHDIHFQLWRSFQQYDARCSVRTWVYRVAHHVAVSHVLRERRMFSKLVSLEEFEMLADKGQAPFAADQKKNLERLSALIQQLKPLDRQVIVSYLEDLDAKSIAEVTGLSPGHTTLHDVIVSAPCLKVGSNPRMIRRRPRHRSDGDFWDVASDKMLELAYEARFQRGKP